MSRKSYVQDPQTGKLIPKDEYRPPGERTHHVMPPLEPFVSHVDGTLIRNRQDLKAHNRRNGVTNTADYGPNFAESSLRKQAELKRLDSKADRKGRVEAIKRALIETGAMRND